MPSGGYGLNPDDGKMIEAAIRDSVVYKTGILHEWLWAYASARGAGASPEEASRAAYEEWDL